MAQIRIPQAQINMVYMALGNIAYTGITPIEVAKIMRVRKAMRPLYESYQTFDEEVRRAQENFERLAEIEMKDEKSEEDIAWYKEHIHAFVEGVNVAIRPELEKEYDIEVEKLSDETAAYILSNSSLTPEIINFLIEE